MTSNRYMAAGARRWTPSRKAALLRGVEKGDIGAPELAFLGIAEEELAAWRKLYKVAGEKGLRTTKLKFYRTK